MAEREQEDGRRLVAREAHREDLKREMDRLCRDYESAAKTANALREDFDANAIKAMDRARDRAAAKQKQADEAIRSQLEKEALALGFRMSPRTGAPAASPKS